MPEIARFLGIIITMYFEDHAPPHFHVRYNDQNAVINIQPLALAKGKLSPRILGLVFEWASLHEEELLLNWEGAKTYQEFTKIKPLD